ncbi:LacI family DNA-binding transcriptional regulator [Planctomonas sp. JC2975]|uniref:LacI family DNA-binding transcriptional regulator n=1 Tax=Planctomonas sp. JC2975 TaxID=2729626 RepID=UPI0014765DDA|nr:LacI family DNA-binding transcriptional regulator [Planctomonas sp. JC2975]NNC13974.1 LacI family DNA-binding transcriptional regulator [Planctomonas sp. JC2975]
MATGGRDEGAMAPDRKPNPGPRRTTADPGLFSGHSARYPDRVDTSPNVLKTAGPAAGSAVKPATINDVAAAAGVSRQTVTRALNDLPDVSAVTKQRVQDAAAALHYRPNRAAQRLVRGRDVTVGFVVGDLRNPYYPELAAELTRQAAERDWGVVVSDIGGQGGAERVDSVVSRVDAVIGHLVPAHRGLVAPRIPSVFLTDDPVDGVANVQFDYEGAVRDAVEHLMAGGRRRITMIDGGTRGSLRARLLQEALEQRGLPPAAVIHAPDTHMGGVAAITRLLEAAPQTDAVLCFNDVIAVGALKGFARARIRVPDDIAVIGIDGLDIGTLVTPELTTLAIDMGTVARHALDLADALFSGKSGSDLRRTVPHTLVVRESA